MSAPTGDDENSELRKDDEISEIRKSLSKRLREPPPMPAAGQLYVTSESTVPSSMHEHQDRLKDSEFVSAINHLNADLQRKVTAAPRRRESSALALIGRIAAAVTFAALVALLTIFAKPLWQGARALLNADSQSLQAFKPSDRLTANNAPPNSPLVPATKIAAASGAEPSASPQAQQAPLSPISHPLGQEPKSVNSPVRGVTDSEIRFGISAPFSGAAKELGQNMKLGIEAAFNVANASGGVHGRQLRLIAADDGYEPTRTAETIRRLYETDQVFGLVGNVGTPTAAIALPYTLERRMLFYGAFTGAGLLRSDPPDRYVFNYRASYAEETDAVVRYLVKVRRLKPEEIAVFAQQRLVRRRGLRRRSQGYPFTAGGRRDHNFAAQLQAQHRGCGRGRRATPVAQFQESHPNKSGDHGAHLSGRGEIHREDA